MGLSYKRVVQVERVGVHPSNREGQILSLADVLDLVRVFCDDGWNKNLTNMVAAECPRNAEGDEWRALVNQCWQLADGYLAQTPCTDIDVVTILGGHSTSAVRAIKFSARSDDVEIAPTGHLQKGAILDRNTTLRDPINNGIEYGA